LVVPKQQSKKAKKKQERKNYHLKRWGTEIEGGLQRKGGKGSKKQNKTPVPRKGTSKKRKKGRSKKGGGANSTDLGEKEMWSKNTNQRTNEGLGKCISTERWGQRGTIAKKVP